MPVVHHSFFAGTLFILSMGLTACSFSTSSGSLSESSNSFSVSSNSISDSVSSITSSPSESSKGGSRYQNDVEDFTAAYVDSANNTDITIFQRGISDIASREGVVNWEQDEKTYIGIGRGLKNADLSEIKYESFKKIFAEGDYQKMKDIQKGFDID